MFTNKIQEAEKEYGSGQQPRFKFKPGVNRVRILAGGEPIATHWIGDKGVTCVGKDKGCGYHGANAPIDKRTGKEVKPSVKFAVYLLDRADESNFIHLVFLPWSVVKALDDFAQDDDYKFETLPMPYDISVKFDPDASPADMYKVIPSPKREQVSEEIVEQLSKLKPVKEIVQKIKDKTKGNAPDDEPTTTETTEDLPF